MLDELEELALQVSDLIPFTWFRCEGYFKGFVLWFVFAIDDLFAFLVYWAEAYSNYCQTSKMEPFAKVVMNWKLFFFLENSILEVWPGSEYISAE